MKKWRNKVFFGIFHPIKCIKKNVRKKGDRKKFVSKEQYLGSSDPKPEKTLIYFNHYFNPESDFPGKSTKQKRGIRKRIVERCLDSLNSIPNAEVYVCGIEGRSLLPLDIELSHLDNPAHIVYESIEKMFKHVDEYSYFINIEDDILFSPEVLVGVKNFDIAQKNIRDCWHPNRLESADGRVYCPDFIAKPGWIGRVKYYCRKRLRVGVNPHSGLMVLSRSKMRFALENINLSTREIIIGYYMASAYANVNKPFNLYRSQDLEDHAVHHLDQWEVR